MKSTAIKRWVSSQENLYFLFAAALMTATCMLFFTEPMTAVTRVAFLTLPLSLQMGLLLLFKKPGVMFLLFLPKLVLDAFQLVVLYLFNESIIAVDMFLNVVSTNTTEAGELLGNITPVLIAMVIVFVPCLILAVYSIRNKNILSPSFRKKMAGWSLILFFTGLIFMGISIWRNPRFNFKTDIYPANILYNLDFAAKKYGRIIDHPEMSKDFSFEAHRDSVFLKNIGDTTRSREIYMLVIGETARAANWSLYGYERETNPGLSKEAGIAVFTDALTQSNTTHKSVPLILSYASAEDFRVIYHQKSIITAFKEAGFTTFFLSNQVPNNSFTDYFSNEADKRMNVSPVNTQFHTDNRPDGEMIPLVKAFMDSTEGNLFIVLHTYGSHFNYNNRYPEDFSCFRPDQVESIRRKYRTELVNAYDNSIRYTDHVLTELIGLIREEHGLGALMYLSDHGEDIMDDQRGKFLHASPVPTYYQLHIPYLIWFSENFRNTFPENYQAAVDHRNVPVSTNSVFHTLLDLAGIATPYFDPGLSLVNRSFAVRPRNYLDDHEKAIEITSLRLKKQDYEMFGKHRIQYEFQHAGALAGNGTPDGNDD